MEILLLSFIVIVTMFAVYIMGQNRANRKKDHETMNLLIEIRTMNSKHEPLDAWLTDKINPLMSDWLKRGKR